MSSAKKTIFVKPSSADKENWISGNAETQKPGNADTQKKVSPLKSKEPLKRLTIELPQSTHKAFKLKALNQSKTMLALVREWIENFIQV